ncbi:NAD+ synthase [Pelobium manganitolerans]|uniref:Glutamine-dependent NAD(+) synthetase n=1 Tax=Pelobium manganitolerans TaxID=1842495 RepID=A0A419S7G2_9SPHI|nr:NAD+ synthase [Pelobium manganitolerans]RKD17250.1 NAD+ synthase [Pelobium manganitolerans]
MRIALAQLNYHIGNFEDNTQKIIDTIAQQELAGADLVVFSELCVSGYPPRDYLEYQEFVEQCEASAHKIALACTKVACIIGLPIKNDVLAGKDLYNAAYFIANGRVEQVVRKALLPTYDIFDEYRYFEPAQTFKCVRYKNHTIALTICEDLWNLGDNPLYPSCPMDELMKESPDFMINIAASPFSYQQYQERTFLLSANCRKYALPLFYVNHVGAQTELIFDGGSLVFDKAGDVVAELKYFEEDVQLFDVEQVQASIVLNREAKSTSDIEEIYKALVLGIKDYFRKSGFKSATLGLSGGIDSAVVCALACDALGAENVLGVLMPSKYSSEHSIKDAEDLASNLGCKHTLVSIEMVADAFESTLAIEFAGLSPDLAEENIQARSRGVIMMAMANKFGHILLNTSNKSECAVGYGTLYGDMCGAISVLGDVYKTQVYQLADFINREKERIPINTITKAPSAELRPDQKDSDSLPDYDVLDKILFEHIERRKSAKQITADGFDEMLVRRILSMVNRAEFKRYQTPPILRVSPKAFGMGRRMPIVSKYLS